MLLAHGATGSVERNFGPLIEPLARRYTIVGADFPGSGETPRSTGPLSLDDLADQLVGAAVRAGVESFAILGYSMGTAVAVRAATRHPDRVSALVLTAGLARMNPRTRLVIDTMRTLIESGDRRTLAACLAMVASGARWLETLSAAELDARIASTTPGDGDLDQLALLDTIDVRADLGRISVPTLVIATTEDHLVTPSHSHELAAGIPHARLQSLDSGHLVVEERGAEWLTMITDFLSAVG